MVHGPNLSRRRHDHRVFPYLLRGLSITAPNQVWGIDLTYIPLRRTWLYLVALLDWYSRYVVEWELGDTMDEEIVLAPVRRALSQAQPAILNSDQGSHFTAKDYVDLVDGAGVLEDALSFLRGFFPWYNREHRHTGIALLTPETVHFGRSEQALISRQKVLDAAFDAHPERFAGRRPQVPQLPKEVWINRPWHASSLQTV